VTLGEKQRVFTEMIGKLIQFAYQSDYKLTFGDAYRDPRVFGMVGESQGYGSATSLHKSRLACDFNLFREVDGNWEYCEATADHEPLGSFWESLGGSWGGRWGDGNHYSLEHDGRW
jgi:hypothetical protein